MVAYQNPSDHGNRMRLLHPILYLKIKLCTANGDDMSTTSINHRGVSAMLLYLLLLPVVIAQQLSGQFFNPPKSDNSRDFSVNVVYTVGDTETIQWTTTLSNYTMTLWQQVLANGGGAATPGPSIFRMSYHCL
jgi:hypothetical protein